MKKILVLIVIFTMHLLCFAQETDGNQIVLVKKKGDVLLWNATAKSGRILR